MFIRNPYNYDVAMTSFETSLECKSPSKTRQDQAEDADIETIVKRFKLTGELPTNLKTPVYGDFSEVFDFQSAQQAIIDSRKEFAKLPAKIRDRFNYDPQKFLEFCTDEKNAEEMITMGLATKRVVEQPTEEPKS